MRFVAIILFALTTFTVQAAESLVQLDIGRGEARLPLYVMTTPKATATLILLPGGNGELSRGPDGKPTGLNFLTRSNDLFHAENFNTIAVYRASDLKDMDDKDRIDPKHVAELEKVLAYAKKEFGKPVWLIGNNRGTISATAAAVALGEASMQGLVLTSSVTSRKVGAVPTQNIASLKMPILVVHHKNDACKNCVPQEARQMFASLKGATHKKLLMIEGGSKAEGDPCRGTHWNGFVNYEKETVKAIADWIRLDKN